MELEVRVRDYIKDNTKDTGMLTIPLSKIAENVDSSVPTVWRAIQRLEDKRVIKVIKPRLKTQPNIIYYLGEKNELNEIIDDLMMRTGNILIIMKELKSKLKDREDTIFELTKQLESR